jgi:hypothetical protein
MTCLETQRSQDIGIKDHRRNIRRSLRSAGIKDTQEDMVSHTLKRETAIDARSTSDMAKPLIRNTFIVLASKSSSAKRRPLLAYHRSAVSGILVTARLAALLARLS